MKDYTGYKVSPIWAWTVRFHETQTFIKSASYPFDQLVWATEAEAVKVASEHPGGTPARSSLPANSVEVTS